MAEGNLFVVLDLRGDEGLSQARVAREITTRVQKLRKVCLPLTLHAALKVFFRGGGWGGGWHIDLRMGLFALLDLCGDKGLLQARVACEITTRVQNLRKVRLLPDMTTCNLVDKAWQCINFHWEEVNLQLMLASNLASLTGW